MSLFNQERGLMPPFFFLGRRCAYVSFVSQAACDLHPLCGNADVSLPVSASGQNIAGHEVPLGGDIQHRVLKQLLTGNIRPILKIDSSLAAMITINIFRFPCKDSFARGRNDESA